MIKNFLLLIFTLAALLVPILAVNGQAVAVDVLSRCGEGSVNGAPDVCSDADAQKGNTGSNNPIIDIIKAAITVLSFIIGIAAVIGLVVSGIRLMTASGDANAVASARSGVIYSLIGIAVVVLAQVLVALVLSKVN
jgi:hypothetical protein